MDIKLRRIQKDDLEKVRIWRMKPSVTKYMNTDPKLTIEDQIKWFDMISKDQTCRYFIIEVDNNSIGLLGITDIDYKNFRCSWVWYIGEEEYRGKGIAKKIQFNLYDYVFQELKLNRLYSHILGFNKHEIDNVHKACGYNIEGILKEHVYKNGEFIDVVVMGITANEWEKEKSKYTYPKISFEY